MAAGRAGDNLVITKLDRLARSLPDAREIIEGLGDNGAPAEYPSASPNVISVGGATLHFGSSGALTRETGWSSSGGGCSAYETPNPAQAHSSEYTNVNCGTKRATPDVSQTGWFTVGGTRVSSPIWAARSADTGAVVNAGYIYGSSITFRDITAGNNGNPCLTGFDLVTGRGSWTG